MRGCERQWGYRYASRTPKPPTKPSAALGTELHAIQEAYLTYGTTQPDTGIGNLAREGIPHLPPPGSGRTEGAFLEKIDGIEFTGAIDWIGPPEAVPEFPPGADVVVLDHKTSSNPRKHGIWTRADRIDNPQCLIYGYVAGPERVGQRWLYYPTKGRSKPRPSDEILTRRELRGGVERIVLPLAEKILTLRDRERDPLSLQPNYGNCDAYGGCEYRALCQPTSNDVARSLFGDHTMGLWDQINPNGAAAQPPAQQPPAQPPAQQMPQQAQPPAQQMPQQASFPFTQAAETAQAAAPVPQDALARIGQALIAAGKVLCGG